MGGEYDIDYDSYGNIVKVAGPLEQNVLRHYDPLGGTLIEQHPSGASTRYKYVAGREVEWVDPTGERFRYGYDPVLRLRWIENPAGERHLFDYDETHCLVREVSFAGVETRYEYDGEGRRVREIRPNGAVVEYRRDGTGKVVAREVNGRVVEQYDRDMRGNVVRASSSFASVSIQRDLSGAVQREVQSTQGWEFAIDYEKDSWGSIVKRRYSTGWGTRVRRGAGGVVFGVAVERAKNDFEELVEFEYKDGSETVRRPNAGDAVISERNVLGRKTKVSLSDSTGKVFRERAYEWSVMPAVARVEDSRRGTRRYEVDPIARITRAQGLGAEEHVSYSPQGTPLTPDSAPVGRGGRVLRNGRAQYQWDGAGRLSARIGNSPQTTWKYTYDHDDRLVEATRADGFAVRYYYDPFGRRLAASGNDGVSTYYGWDAQSVVESLESTGHRQRRVFRDDGVTPLLDSQSDRGFRLVATDTAGTPWFYLGDEKNAAELDLGALGSVVHEQGPVGTRRFAGQDQDRATGLYYNVNRYYSPELGLYTTPDPLGLTGVMHDLAFVPNPTAFADPLGLIIINAAPTDAECTNGATQRSNATGGQRVVTAAEVRAGVDRNGVPIDLGNLPPGEGVEVVTHGTRAGGQVVWDDGTPLRKNSRHNVVSGTRLGEALRARGLQPGTPVTVVACNASLRPNGTGQSTIEQVNAATGAPTTGPSSLAFIRPDPNASPGPAGSVDTTNGQWDTATGPQGGTPTVTPNSPPTTHPGSW
ncbi:MAG: RHS repeat-associated core domain-containing protein [Polyangiaceae bacterium]|nr:RHS repeat-associated core domain-containing protein [Polyangiaceae bacterium]